MKKIYLAFLSFTILFLLTSGTSPGFSANGREEGWTVVDQWAVNNNASGLTSDGQYLYIGSYGGGNGSKIYRFDPQTGDNELLFTGTHGAAYGLTFDGQYLWLIDQASSSSDPAFALQLDLDGNVISQFNLPDHYMSGIAWSDGEFFVATYYPDPGTIYRVDNQGSVLSSFVPPDDQPWDLALQGDSVWIMDYWSNNIFLTDDEGNLLETFPYDDYRGGGIYYDGAFLWYTGNNSMGNSTLYKVDPWGSGTPLINVPYSHSFGNVTTGESAQWMMDIANDGTGDLIVDNIELPADVPFSFEAVLPITVPGGQSQPVQLSFSPTETGVYQDTLTIHCNDPANPEVLLILQGNGLAEGPYLQALQQMDFGDIRQGSSSRMNFLIKNMGNEQLLVSDIGFSASSFYLDESVSLPLSLNPVQQAIIPVWFFPQQAGTINEQMELEINNASQNPFAVELLGFSDDSAIPLGTLLWEHQFTGSYDFQAKAIMAVPDVNGDGRSDLLVCTRDNYIRLFNGNSSGTSDLLWEIELGGVEYPKSVDLLDDINDDGLKDIVVGTAWGDRAVTAICLKTGSIIWRYQTNEYGQGGWVHMVDAAFDYNDDGYRDVLAATADDGDGTGPKRIFLFNGPDGEIIWEAALNVPSYSVLAVEDFTLDGIPDVVAGAGDQQGKVFGIDGADGSMVWSINTAGTSVWALEQINDITGDGIRDVIAGSFNGHYYLVDAANGNIEVNSSLGNSIILDFWQAGDLNDDGFMDIFPAYSTVPNAVAICGQTGGVIWTTPVPDQPWSVAPIRDISNDGKKDMVLGTLYQNNYIKIIEGAHGAVLNSLPVPSAVDAVGTLTDVTGDYSMEYVAGLRNGYLGVYSGGAIQEPQFYDVSFHVTDNQAPAADLGNALIDISPEPSEIYTDQEGMALVQLMNGTYNYTVTLEGYVTTTGTFVVQGEDVFVDVVMLPVGPDYYNVTFHVTDDQDPATGLEDASVLIDETAQTYYTGQDGTVVIQLPAGIYNYTVELNGFFPVNGTFEVADADIMVNIIMEIDDTSMEGIANDNHLFYCYPNPMDQYTSISFNLHKEGEVSLLFYDINGNVIKNIPARYFPAGNNSYRWNGTDEKGNLLPDGMYFVELITPDRSFKERVLILRK